MAILVRGYTIFLDACFAAMLHPGRSFEDRTASNPSNRNCMERWNQWSTLLSCDFFLWLVVLWCFMHVTFQAIWDVENVAQMLQWSQNHEAVLQRPI